MNTSVFKMERSRANNCSTRYFMFLLLIIGCSSSPETQDGSVDTFHKMDVANDHVWPEDVWAGDSRQDIDSNIIDTASAEVPETDSEASGTISDFPVIVVGAGTGGTMAAIQAARLGVPVALLEETDWVGGQMAAAGVSTMDEANTNIDSGLYKEFWTRAEAYYSSRGKSMATCYFNNGQRCPEASVARKILIEMIAAEPNIHLYLRTRVERVQIQAGVEFPTVTGIDARQNGDDGTKSLTFECKALVDATEYGDILQLASIPFRLANHTSDQLDPAACVQDITYTAVIRKYPDGVPTDLQLTSPPPGYDQAVESSFASIVAESGHDWREGTGIYPANWPSHSSYRGVPDSASSNGFSSGTWESITRTGVNWANDYPFDSKAIVDQNYRREVSCAAKLRTLHFIYYLQNVLGHADWSVANDEGYDTAFNIEDNVCPEIPLALKTVEKYLPQMPYIRESRRMIGIMTLTARDIRRAGSPAMAQKTFRTAMAVGDYPVDLHKCNQSEDMESDLESVDDIPPGFVGGPFQIPFEAFIPQATDGFVAAEKNLSLSRLASGACRLQPITMLTGQAAGAIAALSVKRDLQPRHIPPILVQSILVDAGSRLTLTEYGDIARDLSVWRDVQLTGVNEVMTGDGNGNFRPNDQLKRSEGAVVIARLFGLSTSLPPATSTYADVKITDWFFPYVEALHAEGLAISCSNDPANYCPDIGQDRAGFAVMLARGMGLDLSKSPSAASWIDVPTANTAFAEIEAVTKLGILMPCETSPKHFCPDDAVGRGDAAGLVARALVLMN